MSEPKVGSERAFEQWLARDEWSRDCECSAREEAFLAGFAAALEEAANYCERVMKGPDLDWRDERCTEQFIADGLRAFSQKGVWP